MIKVYECYGLTDENGNREKDLTLELWGGSTKHPDSKFYFSEFKKSPYINEEDQVFQWLLECASKLTWPFHAKELAEYALKNHYTWNQGNLVPFLTGCSRPLLAANSPNFPLYHMLAILSSENSLCNLHKFFPFQSRFFYLQFIKKFVIIIIEIKREINLLKISKKK